MGFLRYVQKFEGNRPIETSHRKISESNDSNYANKGKRTPSFFKVNKTLWDYTSKVNVSWSSNKPMEGLFNDDDDLELSMTAKSLRHSSKTVTEKEVFL